MILRHTFPLIAAALASATAAPPAPPTPAEIDALLADGYRQAAEKTGTLVMEHHQPLRGRLDLNRSREALEAWITLHRWCALLARDPVEHDAAVLGHHLYRDGDQPELILLQSGVARPDGLDQLEGEELLEFAASPAGQRALRRNLLAPAAADLPPPSKEFLQRLVTDAEWSAMVLEALSPRDHVPTVLRFLEEIEKTHPADFREYPALATAIAITNDARLPADWPHHQVARELFPLAVAPVTDQFASWVAAHRGSRLLLDPRKLSPAQLAFMVDAYVEPAELDWARKNVRLGRSTFDRAFDSIAYDDGRLAAAEFTWTAEPYTLEAISERGGICVDQAWFAALAGKARGLPTLFFTGQGADGGHAWFGYMRADDRWEVDCGRHARGNYAVGEAMDPRTWLPITDHELLLLASNRRDTREFRASAQEVHVAALQLRSDQPAKALETLQSAIAFRPDNPDLWDAMTTALETLDATAVDRLDHHRAAATRFSRHPDIEARHSMGIARILREQGKEEEAARIERSILLRNRRDRPDISIETASDSFSRLLEEGDLDGAGAEFRRQLRTLGGSGGGTFFQLIAKPYIMALIDSDDGRRAERELRSLRRALRPERGSVLDLEIALLEEKAGR
jgi:tetratricopeptide (TPR) repeat protein